MSKPERGKFYCGQHAAPPEPTLDSLDQTWFGTA
jgi:hypothetical protein